MTQILGCDSVDGCCIITERGSRWETGLGGNMSLVSDTVSFQWLRYYKAQIKYLSMVIYFPHSKLTQYFIFFDAKIVYEN